MKEVNGRTSKAARRDYILGDDYTIAGIKKRLAEKIIVKEMKNNIEDQIKYMQKS